MTVHFREIQNLKSTKMGRTKKLEKTRDENNIKFSENMFMT